MRILRKQFFERLQKNESAYYVHNVAERHDLNFIYGYASLNDDSVNSKVKKEK